MNTVSLKKEKAVSDKAKVILESPTPLPKGTTVLGCFQFSVLCILKNIDFYIFFLYPATFSKSLITSRNFFGDYLGIFYIYNLASCK